MGTPLREVLAAFEIDVNTSKLEEGVKQVEGFKKVIGGIKGFAKDVLKGFSFDDLGVGSFIKDLQSQAGEIGGVSRQFGVGSTQLQRLMYQTGKGAGELGTAFRTLSRNVALASKSQDGAVEGLLEIDDVMGGELPGSGKKAAALFKSLGVTQEQLAANDTGGLFVDIAEKISKMGDVAQRNRAAMLAFGPDGPSLIKDAEAMRALGEEFDKIGGFTEEDIKRFKELGRVQKTYNAVAKKAQILLAAELLPAVTAVTGGITWLAKKLLEAGKASSGFQIAGIAIIGILAAMNLGTIRFALNTLKAVAPWLALFLILDDIATFFRGGDSLLGRFLDKMGEALGWGPIGKEAQAAFKELFDFIENSTVTEVWEGFQADAERIWKFGIPDAVKVGLGMVWNAITGQTSDVLSRWQQDMHDRAKSAAASFIDGLVQGITEGIASVEATVGKLGSRVLGSFKTTLGIKSPSTEGATAGQGMASSAFGVAPTLSGLPGGAAGPRTANLRQENKIEINVTGEGARGIANATRDAINQPFNDNNRAMLASLEEQHI